mmetsp:Transcript_23657/g.54163  ORF Transcript_23657/g.54163 Transcript_23657/m.54163 type:complete len:373 (+) Transcript_23657:1269-2387(+)
MATCASSIEARLPLRSATPRRKRVTQSSEHLEPAPKARVWPMESGKARDSVLSGESRKLVPLEEPRSRSLHDPSFASISACIAETDWSGRHTSFDGARPRLVGLSSRSSCLAGGACGVFRFWMRSEAAPPATSRVSAWSPMANTSPTATPYHVDGSFSGERRRKVPLNEPRSATSSAPPSHQSAACCPETSGSLSRSSHEGARPMRRAAVAVCLASITPAQYACDLPTPISQRECPSGLGGTSGSRSSIPAQLSIGSSTTPTSSSGSEAPSGVARPERVTPPPVCISPTSCSSSSSSSFSASSFFAPPLPSPSGGGDCAAAEAARAAARVASSALAASFARSPFATPPEKGSAPVAEGASSCITSSMSVEEE